MPDDSITAVAPATRREAGDGLARRRRIILGTFTLADEPQDTVDRVLDEYVAEGGAWLDTAYAYGHGAAETKIGSYLSRRPGVELKLSTKIGHFSARGHYRSQAAVEAAFADALGRLRREPDQLLLHEADWRVWWHDDVASHQTLQAEEIDGSSAPMPLAPALGWIADLARARGLRWGFSGNNAPGLMHALARTAPDTVLVAKQYDLLWRSAATLADAAEGAFELWLGSPFHQGWLFRLDDLAAFAAGPGHRPDLAAAARALSRLLAAQGGGVVAPAIAFLLDQHAHTRIVAGVRAPGEIGEILRAAERRMAPELADAIRRLGVVAPPMRRLDDPLLAPGAVS